MRTNEQRIKDRLNACELDPDLALRMLIAIADALWPDNDPDHEWDSETIEQVAGVFHNENLAPTE